MVNIHEKWLIFNIYSDLLNVFLWVSCYASVWRWMVFVKGQASTGSGAALNGSGSKTDSTKKQINISDSTCSQQGCARDEPAMPGADGASRKEKT
jgi:hypothetical protein